MNQLDKKQKIILGIVIGIVAIFIYYYVYAKENNNEVLFENNAQIEENINEIDKEEFSDTTLFVHVSGAVQNEGIYELKTKTRIADAIDKAGGLKENADISNINLAYLLEDGMKIYIPSQGENKIQENIMTSSGLEENNTENKIQTNNTKQTKININTATQTELESLPGIGPSTAMKIIAYRQEKGKFKSIEEIKDVSGIGDSKYNNIKDLIDIKN